MRDLIISEIKRLAAENGDVPPGVAAFRNATGITIGKWRGVYWARWNDAIVEAGFSPNTLVVKRDTNEVLLKVAELCRTIRRMPTYSDMRLQTRSDPTFPTDKTVASHFGGIAELKTALRALFATQEYADLADILPVEIEKIPLHIGRGSPEGWVYLLKSGPHHKIGRSDQLEARVKRINIALPEATTLIHAIRTDDPPGIEAYWHRRFADRRANGEWFRLTGDDVRAFSRRKFQ